MIHQDLLFLASELPKIAHIDHERMILDSYRSGGWRSVDSYVAFVKELHIEMNPKESRRSKIVRKCSNCITWIRKFIKRLVNSLKPYRYTGVVTGKDAERFLWNMNNPRKVSKEEIERIREAGENFNKIMNKSKI